MAKTKVVNPRTVSDYLKYPGNLTNKEKNILKKNYSRLWEVMAAGTLIPVASFQARTINFEYLPKDQKELIFFAAWLEDIFNVPITLSLIHI